MTTHNLTLTDEIKFGYNIDADSTAGRVTIKKYPQENNVDQCMVDEGIITDSKGNITESWHTVKNTTRRIPV